MELYVVRHGETDFNVQDKYGGSMDILLNDNGLHQAERLVEELVGIPFDVIVTSPLLRARQTTEVIKKVINAPVIVVTQFAERNLGVFEGLTQEEVKALYPDLYERKCTRQLDDAPTGGETIRQFNNRITSALEKLKADYPDKKVLLVCHGFVSRMINRYYKNLSYDEMYGFMLGNCEAAYYKV